MMDPKELYQEEQKFFKEKCAQIKRKNSGFIKESFNIMSPEEAESLGVEHNVKLEFQMKYLQEIKLMKSSSSCLISEIEGFVYGPFTSRFWVMRKHIN